MKDFVLMDASDDVFARSDIVSIHVPLTEATRKLIGQKLLNMLKPEALFINTSRGDVVDEEALVAALEDKKLSGAGLDVFSGEQLKPDNPLCKMENVVLTPHSAALTKECRFRMARDAVNGVLDVLAGRDPEWVFNRPR